MKTNDLRSFGLFICAETERAGFAAPPFTDHLALQNYFLNRLLP